MTKNRRIELPVLVLLLLVLIPSLALGHPGHDHGTGGLVAGMLHPLTGFDHVFAAIAAGVWAFRGQGRSMFTLPAAFLGSMVLGAGIAGMGVHLPAVEPMVALSVITLGVLVATKARWSQSISLGLLAVFGVFHGAAHVSELAAGASVWSYTGGLLLASALLLLAGIGVGYATTDRAPMAARLGQAFGALTACAGVAALYLAVFAG